MKVLVTGATGFVGLPLARYASGRGEVVAHVSDRADVSPLSDLAGVTIVRGDLTDNYVLDALVRARVDVCVHPAWYANPRDYLDSPRNIDSLAMTLRLAHRLGEAGCRRFVGVGTCFEYDTSGRVPLAETSPLAPARLYSACKVSAWLALEQVGQLARMSTAWSRLFYLYGPREDPQRLVPSIANALLAGREAPMSPGEQVRDFLHVDDVASALWAVAASEVCGPINVGSGVPVTVAEIARVLAKMVDREHLVKLGALPYRPGDPMFVCADVRRLVAECGWTRRFSLELGLRDAVDWWRARSERAPGPAGA